MAFYNRGGGVIDTPKHILDLSWGRRLDNISSSTINFSISDLSCCSQLGILEPIAHSMSVIRNNAEVWYGTIKRVEYGRDLVQVQSDDGLFWLDSRIVHEDHSWTKTDLTDIFVDLFNDAMLPDPISQLSLATTPTLVLESRKAKASDNRYVWNIVQEMLDTGLDVTAFGRKILVGIMYNSQPLELRLGDVQGDPKILKDGTLFGNKIIVDANEKAVGIYPPSGTVSAYPLVEKVLKDGQIQDAASALNAAKSRYEFSKVVPRLVNIADGIQLQPNSALAKNNLNLLIPGSLITVNTEGLCYDQKEVFRLGNVDVTVAGGIETVSLSLQPTGPEASLEESF